MRIRSQSRLVYLDVAGESAVVVGSKGKAGYSSLTPQTMVIQYEWYPETKMWRVTSSSVEGYDQRAATAHHRWVPGSPEKPMWVVALEHRFHPDQEKKEMRR